MLNSETMQAIGRELAPFTFLFALLAPQSGNDRWEAVQQWIKDNPEQGRLVEDAVKAEPEAALDYLITSFCRKLQFPKEAIGFLDPVGTFRKQAREAIRILQQLYEERAALDRQVNDVRSKNRKEPKS